MDEGEKSDKDLNLACHCIIIAIIAVVGRVKDSATRPERENQSGAEKQLLFSSTHRTVVWYQLIRL